MEILHGILSIVCNNTCITKKDYRQLERIKKAPIVGAKANSKNWT